MKKYFRLFIALSSLSLKRFFEHRLSAYGNLSLSLTGIFLLLLFLEVIYSKVPKVVGWEKYEILFLVGFYRIIFNLFYCLFVKSIDSFPGYIKAGELDIILTKPVNSQFFVSLRHTRLYELAQLIPSIVLIIFAILNLPADFYFLDLFVYLISTIVGLTILYCIYFSLATLAIWLVDMEALPEFQYALNQAASYPVDIFGRTTGILLTFIIPIAFVVTFPVKVLLNKSSEILIVVGILIAMFLFIFTSWFWNFALKHYTSASS